MEESVRPLSVPEAFDPSKGARYWYEKYCEQYEETERLKARVSELEKDLAEVKELLNKLTKRTSKTSSLPPSSDRYKKGQAKKSGKKRGPKYDHPGKTRNGFGFVDRSVKLELERCPVCGGDLRAVSSRPVKREQIAELLPKLVEVVEYERPAYDCPDCGWSGISSLPPGCKEGFSYGGMLSALVGWLGYGGNLSWSKQRYVVESILGLPMSQGSLSKMHQWFCESLQPAYEQWWEWVQTPGVRCLDETSYRLNGVNHWIWVATGEECCLFMFAPTRSSKEAKALLGEEFEGILSSDCWSGYSPVSALAKQKCFAHVERALKALLDSTWEGNRQFAEQVLPLLSQARQVHREFHQGHRTLENLQSQRPEFEARLTEVIEHPPPDGWPCDALDLANRFIRHQGEWFTFLEFPAVKPDNNDAERALRPIVIHRKVSGGARSDWGAQLVASMFSFLETMRLQGKNAVEELFAIMAASGNSVPPLVAAA